MEENNNNVNNVENSTENTTNKVVETLKAKKNLIIGVIVVLLVVFLGSNIFLDSPKKSVKKFYSAMNSGKSKKMLKEVDWAGVYTFAQLDEDEYEDFWDEYKEYTDSDEWEEVKEELDDNLDDLYEELDDSMEDSEAKYKVKKITKVEKVGKNLYKVKAKIEMKEDDDKETETITHYVMKDGLNYYIVGGGMLDYLSWYL